MQHDTTNRSRVLGALTGLLLGAATLATVGDARATDVRTELGAAMAGSEWRGDVSGYSTLKFGARFADVVGPYGQVRVGYGSVDDRLLTLVGLGAQVWIHAGPTRPYAKAAFIHQHEESLSVVANDFGSAVFGIGDGIRHRAGAELGLGVDIPFFLRDSFELFVNIEGSAQIFPDEVGPMVYGGGGAGVGFNYGI